MGVTCLAALPFAAWGALAPTIGIALPLGLRLTLDSLGAFFLLPVLIVGAAAAACVREDAALPWALPLLPLFVAVMVITLLAADGVTLVLGFEAMVALSWGAALAGGGAGLERAGRLYVSMSLLSAVALLGAVALLVPPDRTLADGLAYAAMRTTPVAGWRAGLVFLLALVGAGGTMGLAPLHLWLPPAHAAAPGAVSALTGGAMTGVAAYVLTRILLDLCGPATPPWWGAPLLILGALSAVLGALRANLEEGTTSVLAASAVGSMGLVATALGAALAARGADLPALAALALGAALLHALAHSLFKGLLFLCAGIVGREAGTYRLGRLGGLVHAMPVTTLCALAGAASLATVPLSAGFAGRWMLLQALVAGPRTGSLAMQVLFALGLAAVGLATALGAAAAVRLVGVAFLGRPRTPRAAAATEASRRERLALSALALLALLLGLAPALGLSLADGAVRALTGAVVPRAGLVGVGAQAQAPGYAPVGVLLLCALAAAGAGWWLRARSTLAERRGAAWEGGGSAPPPWLPFGDPATQYGPESFAQPVLRALGVRQPGSPMPARSVLTWQDPAAALHHSALVLRRHLSTWLNPVQRLTMRRTLALLVTVLLALLVIAAVLRAW